MHLRLTDRQWNWMDDGVLAYALAAMRAVWVWLLVHLAARAITPTRGEWMTLPTILALLVFSTLLAQYGIFRTKSDAGAALLVSLGGLVAVIVALYLSVSGARVPLWDARWLSAVLNDPAPGVVVLVVAIVLWRWGILAGRERVLYDVFAFNFALGVIAFVVALALAFGTNVVSLYELVLPLLFFFAIALGTLALSSLQDARRYEGGRTGQQIALNRYWLGTVGAIIGTLLLGGVLLTQLFAPDALAGVLNLLSLVLGWLAQVLFWVLVAVTFVVFAILEFFARFFPPLQISSRTQDLQTPSLMEQFKDLEQHATQGPSPEVYAVLQILAGVILAGMIVLIFAWAFRRFRYLDEEEIEETRESIFSLDLAREQLAQLLRRPRTESPRAPFVTIDGDDPRAQIRRTYQALLAWASAHGVPRAPGMTPYEYLRALERELGVDRAALDLITRAYAQARYSDTAVETMHAQAVERAWQQIVQSSKEDRNGTESHDAS